MPSPATTDSAATAPPTPRKRRAKLPLILALVVVVAALGAGGWWWLAHDAAADADAAEAAEQTQPAQYLALEPAFVVNLADEESRYLQLEVQVMARDPAVIKAVELHMPAIRNRLLLLFSQQHAASLHDRAGKERLQTTALREVQALLRKETDKSDVQALYFTSFVTQ